MKIQTIIRYTAVIQWRTQTTKYYFHQCQWLWYNETYMYVSTAAPFGWRYYFCC